MAQRLEQRVCIGEPVRKVLAKFCAELVGAVEVGASGHAKAKTLGERRIVRNILGTVVAMVYLDRAHPEREPYGTIGVSTDIIEASWLALVDGINYKLLQG